MFTNAFNVKSDISDAKIARIREKFLKEMECIQNQDVSDRVISYKRALRYFKAKSDNRDYQVLKDVILRYMGTILDVEKRCNTEHLKEVFDIILPELTESCGIIAMNYDDAPFLLHFFSTWSEIIAGADKDTRRHIALEKSSALADICETIFKTGHFHAQLNGLEVLLRYIQACEVEVKAKVLKDIIPCQKHRRIRDLLFNIDLSNFEFDGRDFLNEFNMNISEEEPVYSIAVEKGYIDEKPLIKPMHEGKECVFWVDFNSATESISFYCQSTTFYPNSENWTNIEVKLPKINIERGKCEFQVFANRDNVQVYPLSTRQIFLQTKIIFRFTFVENDLSNLQRVVSCYNLNKKTNNAAYAGSDDFCNGFKTINSNLETEWLEPKLPLPKIETKLRKQDLTWENRPQKDPEKQFFENTTSRINKNQKDVLAFKSDISSVQNTSTDNKKITTEEIVSTSEASKVNMQRTTEPRASNTVTKDSNLCTEIDNSDKITQLKAKLSAHKRNYEMNNGMPFKEMNNFTSGNQKVKKSDKSNIETVMIMMYDNVIKSGKNEINTVKYDNREMNTLASGSHVFGKRHSKTVAHNSRGTINAKINQKTKTKNSGKAEIETVVNSYCTQKVNTEKSGKMETESISDNKIPSDTIPKNKLHIPIPQNTSELNRSPEIISENRNSDYIQKESGPETNTEKVFDTNIENPHQNPKSSSKRKLYNSTSEVHIGSELSKDSQLQRRKYLQERRKRENRNSLKLINLVKPMEFSKKNDDVKDHEISNVTEPIAGNEEEIQEVVEEYVNNKGYVGIKSSLQCPGVADKFTPQQQETIKNNLKTLNSKFVNPAKKFFKSDRTLHIEQLDVYDVRNIKDPPAPAKRGRPKKVKAKIIPLIKNNVVPKYVGPNTNVSHSYRRSKGNNPGNTVNVVGVDPTSTTEPVEITSIENVTPRKTLSPQRTNTSPEIDRSTSAIANKSMAPNTSLETKDCSGERHEAEQKNNLEKQPLKRDNAQNDSHKTNSMDRGGLTEVKSGKYRSYGENCYRNLEKSLDRINYPRSATITQREINFTTNVESNWFIKKFLDSLSDQNNVNIEIKSSSGDPIIKNCQNSCELDCQDYREENCFNNFEDDNVNLDSCNSHKNNEGCQTKESLEKRKSAGSKSKEIVPYKKVRTETTTGHNGDGIWDELLSNLIKKSHQFFAKAVANLNNSSDTKEIKRRLNEQLSTFVASWERHSLQASESWKQIQNLRAQINKEKERFHLELCAIFNQFSQTHDALAELENISKVKDAEQRDRIENVRSRMKEEVTRIAKAEWETYVNNLTNNIIKNIQKHMDLDLQL